MICDTCGRRFPNQFNIQTCRVCAGLGGPKVETKSIEKCRGCGADFVRKPLGMGRPQLFCSKECQRSDWTGRNQKKPKPCMGCGKMFIGNRTCSKECSKATRERTINKIRAELFGPPRTCDNCNQQFTYNKEAYMNYCSKQCSKEGRFKKKKLNGHIRRARQAGATIENFKAEDVFLRDGYKCKHCKKKTRPDLKPPHPLYPNLDHIIPLSKGGEHSMRNTQCLCASCNSKKCNKDSGEQLLLFG